MLSCRTKVFAVFSFLEKLVIFNKIFQVSHDLSKFGDRIVSEIDELGRQAELNQPRLEPYDAWGNRVNRFYFLISKNR